MPETFDCSAWKLWEAMLNFTSLSTTYVFMYKKNIPLCMCEMTSVIRMCPAKLTFSVFSSNVFLYSLILSAEFMKYIYPPDEKAQRCLFGKTRDGQTYVTFP